MRILIAVYIAAMVAANTLVWWFGPKASPFIAFLLIGLDLTLRDVMHDRMTKRQMLGVVLVGGAITWAVNPSAAQIAVASATAFTVSAMADWLAYSVLRAKPWMIRANGSNVIGAAVDSILFPTIAFGVLMPGIIAMQFAAKVCGGAIWAFVVRRRLAPL